MAQYKVPQDVEADDKLLGPFSFRQFVYLLITAGLIAAAVGLFQIFPLLVIIPLPFVVLFGALALPLRKDQPMETYLAAIVSYYLKPHKRLWTPGQKDSAIEITAPKVVEAPRTRDITGEEATHRLSFLADIVDTQGYAIKGAGSSSIREDLVAEANATSDMFENNRFDSLGNVIEKDRVERHQDVINEMRRAIDRNENMANDVGAPSIQKRSDGGTVEQAPVEPVKAPSFNSPVVVMPGAPVQPAPKEEVVEKTEDNDSPAEPDHSIMELANNPDFSVATIAKEAKRIKERDEGEVFISLH